MAGVRWCSLLTPATWTSRDKPPTLLNGPFSSQSLPDKVTRQQRPDLPAVIRLIYYLCSSCCTHLLLSPTGSLSAGGVFQTLKSPKLCSA
uniref:Uncharacterized protein n=1 Tax=Nothobranchius furzeri TaxID=105023 RepID=A0A8C6NZW7_NOTFU